ncbi:hypothetical protein SB2_25495 [Methylobacterium radiotolerans]|nr:hypothetical protein SB3_28220 [Methylobacterium radiotolerans]KTS44094.1 hypothetical protein SB2_25495 [Methylobacterium radiotolerans]
MAALTDTRDTTFKHVLETADGGQLRFIAAHGRIYVVKLGNNGRHYVSTAIPVERARLLSRRLDELCAVTEANGAEIG